MPVLMCDVVQIMSQCSRARKTGCEEIGGYEQHFLATSNQQAQMV